MTPLDGLKEARRLVEESRDFAAVLRARADNAATEGTATAMADVRCFRKAADLLDQLSRALAEADAGQEGGK